MVGCVWFMHLFWLVFLCDEMLCIDKVVWAFNLLLVSLPDVKTDVNE